MKKLFLTIIVLLILIPTFQGMTFAQECATIKDGTLIGIFGEPVELGTNELGYNYQEMFFDGYLCDAFDNAEWCQQYADIELTLKWNDAWLSNKDCLGDGQLDRHYGYPSYRGSGAWLINRQSGEVEVDGKMRKWSYYVEIVAVPLDAYLDNESQIWYEAKGKEIGPALWEEFAIVKESARYPADEEYGVLDKSFLGPGLAQ